MATAENETDLGQVDKAWRCGCGDGHFLSVTWWRNDPQAGFEVDGFLVIEGDFLSRLRTRLREAFQLLTGKSHINTYACMPMDAGTAREIASTLEDMAAEYDKWKAAQVAKYESKETR